MTNRLLAAAFVAGSLHAHALDAQVDGLPRTMLARAHAHNDYEHARPLADALDRGFGSVEADVWLVNDQLLVAHDLEAARPDRTLASLYLDPLRERATARGGRIYTNGPEFLLWIDIKSEAEATYAALRTLLSQYTGMLTAFRPDAIIPAAVRVIVSGNRPRETMAREALRYAAMDGRLADLDSGTSPSLIPVISDNWQTHFTWRGAGELPLDERTKLRGLVQRAHDQGRQIRFWAIPDQQAGWQAAFDAGVDFINTDDLDGLRRFLTRTPPMGQ